ncbi:MAG: VWA domain-containing protein [Myxococcales bacterium]|nr:VWA domain-containing protein [Myxococcales bacterium]MCB9524844.1 VWA domain-containing protein [Myxococcales bacterium]
MMRWGHGEWVWMVALPVLAIGLFAWGHHMRRRLIDKAGASGLIRQLVASVSMERRLFKQLLMVLGLSLLVAAALRPQHGRRPEPLRRTGIDIAIAFDISKSMLARDVQPSRLDAARSELETMLSTLQGHRMALVPFAGVAWIQSPLTADKSAIRLYLDSLDPRQMPVGGTNLAMAIELGTKLLTGSEDRGEKASRSRVLLLITDGEDANKDLGEAAKEAAKKASEAGVKIYAVAIGTLLGEPIPVLNDDGSHAGYQRDSEGKPIYSKLNMDLLEELADLADPQDVEALRVLHHDGSESMAVALANALDTLQKSTIESSLRHRFGEKFQYAILPAVLLLLIEVLLGERARRRRREEAA